MQNPRIGRQISHSQYINEDSIKANFSDDMIYRYLLSMNYKDDDNRTKNMVVILKNPSSADERKADNTIRRVEEFVYQNFSDVKKIYILNIFAIRATDAKDVSTLCEEKGFSYINGPENNKSFIETISLANYIIIAWGGRSGIPKRCYDHRVTQVLEMINEHKRDEIEVYRVNSKKGSSFYPFHACFWGNKFDLVKEMR